MFYVHHVYKCYLQIIDRKCDVSFKLNKIIFVLIFFDRIMKIKMNYNQAGGTRHFMNLVAL